MWAPLRGTALLSTTVLASMVSGGAMASSVSPQSDDANSQVADIVVTGSRIAGASRLASVNTIDRDELLTAGASDMSHTLRLIPANSGSEAQIDQLNNPQSSGTAQFNLRNLGLGSTLVLVDGQRWTNSAVVATDGSAFVDINSLAPAIALERIEVVKDGTSAIYGSDAVAGVVNFITRRDVAAPELRAKYASASGSDETVIEAIGSISAPNGRLLLAASHFHRSALGTDERDFTQAERYGRAGWTAVTSYGQPGSFFLPSTGQFVADADCESSALPGSYKNSPADTFCRLDYSDYFDLVPEETRTQLFADYRATTAGIDIWAQLSWADTVTTARQSPSLPILGRSLIVPSHHPDNPYGEDVLFRGRLLGGRAGASVAHFAYRTTRAAAGLSGHIGNDWTWDAFATASRQRVTYSKPDTLGTALQDALNGMNGTYYNPFGSAYLGTGTANTAQTLAAISGLVELRGTADLITVDAQTSGQLVAWASGSIDVVGGLQYRRSGFSHDWNDQVNSGELLTAGYSPDFKGTQDTLAAFSEARIVLGDALEAQLAARYEAYEQKSGNLSPKLAIRWAPLETLAMRGSWGKGYRAPSVYTTTGAQAAQPSVYDRGSFVFANTLTLGQPDLKPETSRHYNLGLEWRPLANLQLAIDGWRFKYSDLVIKEAPQTIIDRANADTAEGLTGTHAQQRITRSANDAISMIHLRFINASSIETQGIDYSARYQRSVLGGIATASANWTVVDRYDIQVSGSAQSGVGSTNLNTIARSLPQNRGEFAASWKGGRHTLSALLHYTSGYENDRAGITETHIGSSATADIRYAININDALSLDVGIINITDRDPPLAQFFFGYDPVVADPRGRVISLGLSKRF